jgi:hypothetical protein
MSITKSTSKKKKMKKDVKSAVMNTKKREKNKSVSYKELVKKK